ncbi:hypothetical protein N658DRAFT_228450 [Parathielavia hyrcaniae]|uniref:Uncharacterized protein n=1 Tax=Parathielavia hyrcaniae TaxID=113614 RepID=A0AAN6PUM2_9PEZI|nr:hypothetical protein N658DRAFT_228450 [Parathielavia hyrcaniae]
MDHDPRESILSVGSIREVGLARQLAFSSARAAMVSVGSPSPETSAQQLAPLRYEANQVVGVDDGQDQVEYGVVGSQQTESEAVAGQGSRRQGSGPRVLFVADDDDWSTVANADCLHEQPCGHKTRPRLVFRLDGTASGQREVVSHSSPSGMEPPCPEPSFTTTPNSAPPLAGMAITTSTSLLSEIGPFVLEDSSSRDSGTERSTESDLGSYIAVTSTKAAERLQKEFRAIRTADWIVSLPPEATSNPYLTPPVATSEVNDTTTSPENMGISHHIRQQESAIRGNFIQLSKSFKEQPTPPHHQQEPRIVYLPLSLTDSQVDRLAAVLSSEDGSEQLPRSRARNADREGEITSRTDEDNPVPRMRSRSPAKTHQSGAASRARSRSPVKFDLGKTPESQRTLQGFQDNATSSVPSKSRKPRFERHDPTVYGTPSRSDREPKGPPAPIDTHLARAHARMAALRAGQPPAVIVHNPPERVRSPVRQPSQYPIVDDSSSYYSQDSAAERYPSHISPLNLHREIEPKHLSILQEYIDQQSSGRGSGKASEKLHHRGTQDEASSGAELAFSPLAPFQPNDIPSVRKASKTLIGEGGWLENTTKRDQAASPTRAGGFLGSLVKKAKEMIEANQDNRAQRKSREPDKSGRPASRQLAISLSPREQSLLFCELEFVLATALNDYITAQFAAGRLEPDRLRKVAEEWQRKGRPRVVGLRYDLETQLDLVRAHVHDFKFYSRAAATPTAVLGVVDTAKANARVLRVRTFCQPDTVVAKLLLDAQGLFNVLGCPEDQQIKLAEVIAFFKAAMERQRIQALHEHQHHQQQQQQQQQQNYQQQHQQHGGVVASSSAAVLSSATSPAWNSRSPTRQGGDWWGTSAAAAAAGAGANATAGQLKRSKSHGAGKMDPAAYESQDE